MFTGLSARSWSPSPPPGEIATFSFFPEEPVSVTAHTRAVLTRRARLTRRVWLLEPHSPGERPTTKNNSSNQQLRPLGSRTSPADSRVPRPSETGQFSSFLAQSVGPRGSSPSAEIQGRTKRWSLRQLPISPNSRAEPFFDRGEKFMSDVRQRWLRERTPPGKISVDPGKLRSGSSGYVRGARSHHLRPRPRGWPSNAPVPAESHRRGLRPGCKPAGYITQNHHRAPSLRVSSMALYCTSACMQPMQLRP